MSHPHTYQAVLDSASQAGKPGIWLLSDASSLPSDLGRLREWLSSFGVLPYLDIDTPQVNGLQFIHLRVKASAPAVGSLADQHDTLGIAAALKLDSLHRDDHLAMEIVLALGMSPIVFPFPNLEELQASVTIRIRIVRAANQAELAFDTEGAERPSKYWQYHESTGFILLPGQDLVEALIHTTQPEVSGKLYSFSCYRATEYVMLLGLAQTLRDVNQPLHDDIQARWHRQAIMSGEFHDVFLREYGSMAQPLPATYYVPGDRLWFRNPDAHSSDVEGFEGSWVFYLGGGYFNNFWKHQQPFTFVTKCIEIYHWRDGVYHDDQGVLRMDEGIVEQRVQDTLANPSEKARILERMMRMRDPQGVYAEGGCIDSTRESVRWICLESTDIQIPHQKPVTG